MLYLDPLQKLQTIAQSTFTSKHILLEEFHCTHIGGHANVLKTLSCLQETFTWKGIKNDVSDLFRVA